MDETTSSPDYVGLAADIVSAYVAKNSVPIAELPRVIGEVHAALAKLNGQAQPVEEPKPLTPAVPIRKSITPDHIISLEDGKPYKSLKRHLMARGITPAQYREKWGLAGDYPMVAPNYAKQRSELAKSMGLGQQRRKSAENGGGDLEGSSSAPKRGRKPKAA